ncbi:MAG: hypothetical protein ACYDBY_07035 [Thermoanaerobaculia bacterium]
MRPGPFLAAFLLAGLTMSAPGAELYGRPLRGLTPVPIAELQRKAADYDGRTIRVRGEARSERGAFHLVEGDASLRVTLRDADSALPSDATGAAATAEGVFRAKGPGGMPGLEATGLELTR